MRSRVNAATLDPGPPSLREFSAGRGVFICLPILWLLNDEDRDSLEVLGT